MMIQADKHAAMSLQCIRQAEEQIENGDLIQASGEAWGAIVHRLKAIAARRKWSHEGHRDYYKIIRRLSDESPRSKELVSYFSSADSLYNNYHNGYKPERLVRNDIKDAKKLLSMLDDIESAARTRSP